MGLFLIFDNSVFAQTAGTINGPPFPPTDLKATQVSPTTIKLSWTPPPEADGPSVRGYKIEVKIDAGSYTVLQDGTSGESVTSYTHQGIETGTIYTYRVSAKNVFGFSEPSNEAVVITDTIPMFSTEVKKVPFNTHVDELYNFSILPPKDWIVSKNVELTGGGTALVEFSSNQHYADYTPNFLISYLDLGEPVSSISKSKQGILDFFVSGLLRSQEAGFPTKILSKNIRQFTDGYRIVIDVIQTQKIGNEYSELQKEIVFFLLNKGDMYSLFFFSKPDDFNQNVSEFKKSVETFYVGHVEKLPNTSSSGTLTKPSIPSTTPSILSTKKSTIVLGTDKRVDYRITGGEVLSITADKFESLTIDIATTSDGILIITLPRELIDAKVGSKDASFSVYVPGMRLKYVSEQTTKTDRTLTIPFPYGSAHITIYGTQTEGSTYTPTTSIPSWVKNNAKWWAEEKISDSDFSTGIEFLIKEKIIKIPETKKSESETVQKIPGWVKNNAGWWANGQISEDDFIKGIQYLIEHGIIKI